MKRIKTVIGYLNIEDRNHNTIKNINTNTTKLPITINFDLKNVVGYIDKRQIRIDGNKIIANIVLMKDIDLTAKICRLMGKKNNMSFEATGLGIISKEPDICKDKK